MRLAASQEASVRAAFNYFVNQVRSERVMRQVADLLERRRIDDALGIVDTYIVRAGGIIPIIMQRSMNAQLADLANQLERHTPSAISINPGNERAANLLRQNALRFIHGLSSQQRQAIKDAMVDGLRVGASAKAMAREFRDAIGLTPAQRASVRSYQSLLTDGSREALARTLRDRRFDISLAGAIERQEPLTLVEIARMMERYRANMVAMRAETIARTETASASNLARQEVLEQVTEQLGITPEQVERTWSAVQDNRTRDTHAEMDGQSVALDEPFLSPSGAELMYPGDPTAPVEEIANCRCVLTINIRSAA